MTPTNLSTSAMLVGITLGLPRQSRELKQESAQIEKNNQAQTGTVRSSCFYFKRKEAGREIDGLASLKKFQGAMKADLENLARFPFAAGTKLLPAALVEQFIKKKGEHEAKLGSVWTAWADDEYPNWLESGPERMGDLFNSHDFPTLADCAERFKCEVVIAPLGSADQVQRISLLSPDTAQLMTTIADESFAKGVAESNASNWKELMTPLQHLVATLEKPKHKIHETLIGNIIEIVELIPAINLAGDTHLAELAAKAKEGLCKIDPDDLRKSSESKTAALATAKALVAEFTPFSRAFNI